MYAVVKFESEGSCEIVPINWITDNFTICKWPVGTSAKRAIAKNCPLKTIDTIEQLIPKRSKYLLTSSIETSDEEESVRPVRKRGTIIKQSDVEYEFWSLDCDQDNNENSSGTSEIPFPPIPKTLLLPVTSQLAKTSAEIPDNVNFIGNPTAIELAKRFEERVLRQSQRISLDIAELSADVKVLKQRSNLSETRFKVNGLPQLPLKTPEEVMEFSDLVRQSEVTLANIVAFLSRIGGNGTKDCTERIFVKLMTNELANQYNWMGKRFKTRINKLPFTKTVLLNVVIDSVQSADPGSTCKEVEETTKTRLRNAKS
ncbi:unnamed protein product [Allacma fusca]|uniref:DUF4806 domain-containing protein n=1 Tax=Allacma fusca TaxID=39272 RepID=A0A8J2K6C2_9HEXA|nr:unnamed protein product [Allacma fusca]